ncbi:SGNH/GDSL hydrolase family protein [Paenibacillus albiflavus]|uniref:SGNH/GDSL hydrolase family protein n=1 Tax=Paenibacillus albiflavus TaxID=2545760 RepID=A0A4R4ELN4_9BACL|nr:SGNH/GDSL hydrolase family protein [Paenibacillus albiflavus]TCZ79265.1 SGNH/GDSL hydrolase family protein [Paenibacillus albiflavus]
MKRQDHGHSRCYNGIEQMESNDEVMMNMIQIGKKRLLFIGMLCVCMAVLAGCQNTTQTRAQTNTPTPTKAQIGTPAPTKTVEKKLIEPTSPEWLYANGPWKKVSIEGWGEVMKGWMTSLDRSQIGRRAKIETDSTFAVLKHQSRGVAVWIYVDGKLAVDGGISSETNEIPIYIDQSGWHQIEFVFSSNSEISGLYVSPDAHVRKPEDNRKKLVVMGHSYIDGTGSSNYGLTSLVPVLGDILGVESVNQGIGRTDVDVSVPASVNNSGLDRVEADVIQLNPDYVLSVYGYNAAGRIEPEQYQADYAKYLRTIRDALPDTSLFASGMIAVYTRSDESNAPFNQAIKNACSSVSNCTFIDLSGQWNKDNFPTYVSGDGVHPNDAGYRFLAEEYAKAISSVSKK